MKKPQEECFVCGESPCNCKAKRKTIVPRIVTVQLPEPPESASTHRDSMTATFTKEDQEFEAAIRALEPLLHPSEKEKYAYILGKMEKVSGMAGIEAWKAQLRDS